MSDNQQNIILDPEQVSKKGEELYKNKLKPILEPKENGKFVVIDIISEDYFLGNTISEAINNAKEKYPDGRLFHTIKIGYQGVFKMGGYKENVSYGWKY